MTTEQTTKTNTTAQDEIRQSVRQNYARVALANSSQELFPTVGGCCGSAASPAGQDAAASCCGSQDVTPQQLSTIMGYNPQDLKSVPEGANMGLGCGNPVALGSMQPGETVVDLGSGGGFDCFLSAKQVGPTGKVIGVDMTSEMVTKARRNAAKVSAENVEFRLGEIEHLPVADNTADIILSNCVINLSPDKPQVFREALRVLKPGGRLAISDIVAKTELPPQIQNDLQLVSACVGGAATIEDTRRMLAEAGFGDIEIKTKDQESRDLIEAFMPGQKIEDYVVSAYIEAVKPAKV